VNSPYANKVVAKRPEPRRHLEPAEATEFREIVASLPADYFANHMRVILLECLLAHATEAGHISKLIATCSKQNKPDREFVKLLRHAATRDGDDHAAVSRAGLDAPDRLPSRLSQATPRTRASFTFYALEPAAMKMRDLTALEQAAKGR